MFRGTGERVEEAAAVGFAGAEDAFGVDVVAEFDVSDEVCCEYFVADVGVGVGRAFPDSFASVGLGLLVMRGRLCWRGAVGGVKLTPIPNSPFG